MRRAAENYGVPYTTLHDNVRQPTDRNIGGQSALSALEERKLADALVLCVFGFNLE